MTIQARGVVNALGLFFGACAAIGAQVSGSPVRHVRENPGTPLANIVRAGEVALVVESVQDGPLEVLPPRGVSEIEWKTRTAPAIVVVDIVSIEGEVTPRKDWITSHVTASLVTMAKTPKEWNPEIGGLVTFDLTGGEAYVAGTKVLASVPGTKPVEIGKRYLMFVNLPRAAGSNQLRAGPAGIYEMTDSGFRRIASQAVPDDIETTAQAEVLIRIRDAAQ